MSWNENDIAQALTTYSNTLYRFVEDQGPETTLLLVDSADEHDILEAALEETKPEFPIGVPIDPTYYLLTSPFRYQSEQYGSRFRAIGTDDGVLYAAEHERTALYEFVAWRLVFFLESPDAPPSSTIPAIAFSFKANHDKMVDLRNQPFANDTMFTHKTDYSTCQAFAAQARRVGAGIILYQSVRDPEQGANAALLNWDAINIDTDTPTGKNISLLFKPDVVLVISGPRGETQEIPHEVLLGEA